MATTFQNAQQTLDNLEVALGNFTTPANIFGADSEYDKLLKRVQDAKAAVNNVADVNEIEKITEKIFDDLFNKENPDGKKWVINNNSELQLNVENLSLGTKFKSGLPNLTATINSTVSLSNPGTASLKFDVGLNTKSFTENYIQPIFEEIDGIFKPLQDINRVLTTNLPGLDSIGINVNLLSFASEAQAEPVKTFFKTVDGVAKLVTDAKKLTANKNISLGSFSLNATTKGVVSPAPFKDSLDPSLQAFLNTAKTVGNGFAFPILDTPINAFNLLLGKDANLFEFTIAPISTNFSLIQNFPPFFIPPVPVAFNAFIQAGANLGTNPLVLGYDTTGLTSGNPLNGFFIKGDKPIFTVVPSLIAGIIADAGLASADITLTAFGSAFFILEKNPKSSI